MASIDGKLLGMWIDGSFTPCEMSCSIKMANELLDASGAHNGNWKHYIEGYKSWSASVNGKVFISTFASSFNSIFKKNLLPNQTFDIMISNRVSDVIPNIIMRGTVRIQDLNMNADTEGKAEYNVNFIGQGALTDVEFEEYFTIINAMPAWADKPNIVDTTKWS